MSTKKMTAAEITELGRKKREAREEMRAALDGTKIQNADESGFYFLNEACSEALSIGPFLKTRFA